MFRYVWLPPSGYSRTTEDGLSKIFLVTVWVTHAFRREGQNIGGTVVPPASNSNHLVGHSIDFNLDTPSGWCNSDCLDWETNSYAKCFTDKIQADRTLRWGASFNDPVHVDDYLVRYPWISKFSEEIQNFGIRPRCPETKIFLEWPKSI